MATVRDTAWESGREPREAAGAREPVAAGPVSLDGPADELQQIRRHIQANRFAEAEAMVLRNPEIVHRKDNYGNTVLTLASQNNRKRFVKLFLRYGADINAQNTQGNSALHYCSAYNFTEVGDYLISKGADPALRNNACHVPSQMSIREQPSARGSEFDSAVPPATSVAGPPPSSVVAPPSIAQRPPPGKSLSASAVTQPVKEVNIANKIPAAPSVARNSTAMSTSSSKKCVITRGGGATGMITKTAVPIFHGFNEDPASNDTKTNPGSRPVQYPSYKLDSESASAQALKGSENLKSTAVPVYHFEPVQEEEAPLTPLSVASPNSKTSVIL